MSTHATGRDGWKKGWRTDRRKRRRQRPENIRAKKTGAIELNLRSEMKLANGYISDDSCFEVAA
jgi:hypothetical protein